MRSPRAWGGEGEGRRLKITEHCDSSGIATLYRVCRALWPSSNATMKTALVRCENMPERPTG